MDAMSRSLDLEAFFSAWAKRSSWVGIVGRGGGDVGEFHGGVAEVDFRKVVHVVAALGGGEGIREHGVEERAGDFDAVGVEDGEVVFEVVSDLFSGGFEDGLDVLEEGFVEGEIPAFVGFPGEGDAEEFGGVAVEGGGLDIEAEGILPGEFGEEFFLEGGGVGEGVGVGDVLDGFEGVEEGGCGWVGLAEGLGGEGVFAEKALCEGAEFEVGEELFDGFVVALGDEEIFP